MRRRVLVLAALLLGVAGAFAGPARGADVQVFRGAAIHTGSGSVFERGVLVVRGSRIDAVGPEGSVRIPPGAEIRDLGGKVVIPGLVDTHSHISGAAGGADSSAALDPGVRALDGIDIRSPHFVKALAGGITTVNIMPGSGHLLSGQTVYIKIRREGNDIRGWLFCDDVVGGVCGGMKLANGTNSMRQPPFPGTRAKSAAMVRELFVKALDYRAKLERAGDDPSKRPERNLGLEAMLEILDGRRIVHYHTHRHDDISTVLRLAKEFGFTPVIQHGTESWKVAAEIAAAGAPVSLTLVDSPGGKEEVLDLRWEAAALLRESGVLVAFNTDDWITDSRFFLRSPALAIRAGLPRSEALATVTLAAARMLGLEGRVGSLEPGKDADFVVLSGDPFSVRTRIEETWVEGRKVFDLEDAADREVAEGGYGALRGPAHVHHEGEDGV
jgi:imidazolonepropionase-like amidohydrolase